jgi:hypothetical protein
MISGLQNGTIEELDEDPAEEDEVGRDNIDPNGKYYKCGRKNDGTGEHGPNEWLAKKFDEMHDLYQGVPGKSHFAIRQYQQAASICRRTLHPITSGKEAIKIKGVGQSIADRVGPPLGDGALGANDRLTNSSTEAQAGNFTRTMSKVGPSLCSKTFTASGGHSPMSCTVAALGRWSIFERKISA